MTTYHELPPTPISDNDSSCVKTGAWRTWRPIMHAEKCISCYICWKFCPDVSVIVDDEEAETVPRFDYDHCKGCGICAHECPKDAIEMVLEVEQEGAR